MIGVASTESRDIYEHPPTDTPLSPDGRPDHQQPEGSWAPQGEKISRVLTDVARYHQGASQRQDRSAGGERMSHRAEYRVARDDVA